MSEILSEEFMIPFGLSAYKLAQEIHVPVSRIQDILHDRGKITADTSIRLGKFFGISDRYFLDMQDDIDIRNFVPDIAREMEQFQKLLTWDKKVYKKCVRKSKTCISTQQILYSIILP